MLQHLKKLKRFYQQSSKLFYVNNQQMLYHLHYPVGGLHRVFTHALEYAFLQQPM
ncbi:MAG: hypothetical protein IPP72_10990 [Chitinophagaceae bacterium]|nr:hypothetical protein [Chitinophagaceae bacterium]